MPSPPFPNFIALIVASAAALLAGFGMMIQLDGKLPFLYLPFFLFGQS
jgi:hypothetical protein